jgi:hypothetical protein
MSKPMRTAINLAYEELAKAEFVSKDSFEELIKKANVLALLAIAEELARANDREFSKIITSGK